MQTPAISVLAIGYSTGEIHLHNIHTDAPLFTLNQRSLVVSSQTRRVASLSFCSDPFVGAEKTGAEGVGGRILAVGHEDGHVTLWNLEKRRVFGDIRNAHTPSPQGVHVQWLSGMNVLVTSGADNSVKVCGGGPVELGIEMLTMARNGYSILRIRRGRASCVLGVVTRTPFLP